MPDPLRFPNDPWPPPYQLPSFEGERHEEPHVEPAGLPPSEVVPVAEPAAPAVWPASTPRSPEIYGGPPDLCWHCGQPVRRDHVHCPWCAADLLRVTHSRPIAIPGAFAVSRAVGPGYPQNRLCSWSLRALLAMLVGYVLILAVVIASAVILFLKVQDMGLLWRGGHLADEDLRKLARLALQQMLVAGVGSSLVVLASWLVAGSIRPLPKPDYRNRVISWVLGPILILPALFILNIVYAHAMRQIVGEDVLEIQLMRELAKLPLFWVVLTVQPAIFEELFFRYLALGALYDALRGGGRQLAMHLSVLLSAVMFAVAHLGQLVFVPYLLLVGLALGYLRLASGGLALPMLLHFLHNSAVLVLMRLAG
ncbi:hypothetical protein HRbin36_02554 [bacterium HR36]|nr:hypothetical protein HRbin36_02554 [bacterium HR36]